MKAAGFYAVRRVGCEGRRLPGGQIGDKSQRNGRLLHVCFASGTRNREAIGYQITQKGEPFKGHEVSLNSLSDLIVKLALAPGMKIRRRLGVSRGTPSNEKTDDERLS